MVPGVEGVAVVHGRTQSRHADGERATMSTRVLDSAPDCCAWPGLVAARAVSGLHGRMRLFAGVEPGSAEAVGPRRGCALMERRPPRSRCARCAVTTASADAAAPTMTRTASTSRVSAAAVTWSDGSAGCPEPGMMYTQALVPGYRIVLQAGDRVLNTTPDAVAQPILSGRRACHLRPRGAGEQVRMWRINGTPTRVRAARLATRSAKQKRPGDCSPGRSLHGQAGKLRIAVTDRRARSSGWAGLRRRHTPPSPGTSRRP